MADRGTRTVHVWSRKWRLISPSIVRPANVEKATLRSGLEAVDGLHEGEEGDLAEIVVARSATAEAPGDVGGQAHVPLDQLVAQAPAAACGGTRGTASSSALVDGDPSVRAHADDDAFVSVNDVPSSSW